MFGFKTKVEDHLNPVVEAAETALHPDTLDAESIKVKLSAITNVIAAIETDLIKSLPLEREYMFKESDIKLKELKGKKRHYENTLVMPYPRLSLEPFKWRGKAGFPKLCLFDIRKTTVEFRAYTYRFGVDFECNIPYPASISECYVDVKKRLTKFVQRKSRDIKITAHWAGGLIPETVKEKIEKFKCRKDVQLFIVAEPRWEVEVKKFNPDPLLVAYYNGELFLIDKFDLTTLEHYVVSEFSTNN